MTSIYNCAGLQPNCRGVPESKNSNYLLLPSCFKEYPICLCCSEAIPETSEAKTATPLHIKPKHAKAQPSQFSHSCSGICQHWAFTGYQRLSEIRQRVLYHMLEMIRWKEVGGSTIMWWSNAFRSLNLQIAVTWIHLYCMSPAGRRDGMEPYIRCLFSSYQTLCVAWRGCHYRFGDAWW